MNDHLVPWTTGTVDALDPYILNRSTMRPTMHIETTIVYYLPRDTPSVLNIDAPVQLNMTYERVPDAASMPQRRWSWRKATVVAGVNGVHRTFRDSVDALPDWIKPFVDNGRQQVEWRFPSGEDNSE